MVEHWENVRSRGKRKQQVFDAIKGMSVDEANLLLRSCQEALLSTPVDEYKVVYYDYVSEEE